MRTNCTNRLVLTGFVGEGIERRIVKDGVGVTTFMVGLPYDDAEKPTQWETFHIQAWGKLGEVCKEHLTKGSKVLVDGAIRLNRWTDQQNKEYWWTYIRAERVEFIHLKKLAEPSVPQS